MNKRIFVTRKIPDIGIQMLIGKGYTVDVNPKDRIPSKKELIKTFKKNSYDAVLCLLTDKITSEIFDASPSVKLFANYATGFDNIDCAEAKKRGVFVSNAPAQLSCEAVAEHAIALMFALASRIVEADDFVRQGKYKGFEPMNFVGTDVLGKTLGLVGTGRIGDKVAEYCHSLGLKIVYTDPKQNEKIEKEYGAEYCKTVEELLSKADIVSLHVPLLDSTHHLINDARLKLMKPTAFLINTSRGPVVDESALVLALQEKRIAGAGLDVFEFEPKLTKGLSKLQNVILTPHIASSSIEAREEMAVIAASNIIDFFEGKTPRNIVNA